MIQKFKLEPGDILVNVDRGNNLFSLMKRWALESPYSHVFMYTGRLGLSQSGHSNSYLTNVPFLFESNGRGVVIQSLSNRLGQEVVVLRLKSEFDRGRIPRVLEEALKLASDSQSYYDYGCIVKYVIPRIVREKLHLPIPMAWERDERQICSEACAEIFWRAKLDILPKFRVPLPGDFVDSLLLEEVWTGRLSEEQI